MAQLVDYSYFKGEWYIKMLWETEDNLKYRQEVERYIMRYESECLKLFLGYDINDSDNFYNLFMAGKDSETRFIALKNKLIDSTNKVSPIISYIYHKYWSFNMTEVTTKGRAINKSNQVAELIVDELALSRSWNAGVDLWNEVFDWLKANSETYPEFTAQECNIKYINHLSI